MLRRLAALVFLLAATAVPAEEIPLSFSEFSIARTRWEKKVFADSVVKNTGTGDVTGFNAVMVAFDNDREVGRSRPVSVDVLAPGAEQRVSFEIAKCPFFTGYIIEATWFAGGTERKGRFLGRDLFNPPAAERSGPIPGTPWIEVFGAKTERQGKDVSVSLTARNAGEIPATLARIRFKFYNADQVLVREAACEFRETFAYATEVPLKTVVRGVPDFAFLRADIVESGATERNLAEGEFSGEAEVEAAGFRFEDRADGAIRVSGRVRNGKRVAVRNVVIRIQLFQGGTQIREILATPPGVLAPEQTAPFASVMKSPPEFDDYRYVTSYEEDEEGGDPLPPPVDPPPVDPPVDPPLDPPVTDNPKDPPPVVEPKIRSVANLIELAGTEWIDGDWVGQGKQAKFRGGFLLLRFRLTDKNGKTSRIVQDGTVDFTFRAPAKKDVQGRMKVEKFAWGTDARKFTVANAKPGMTGYDPDDETLVVVAVEFQDQSGWNYALDLKFTSGEGDVWEWKGLSDPYRAAAMRPTGRRK